MKICKNCKKTIEDDALVCPYCGCVVKKTSGKKDRSGGGLVAKGALPESGQVEKKKPKKKRKTWLWVLGWIFVFPVPLTILLLRSQKVNKIIKIIVLAIAWLFYLFFASAFMASDPDSSTTAPIRSIAPEEDMSISESVKEDEKANIKDLTFTDNNDVTIKAGESISKGYLKVNVKSKDEFTPDDVAFVSDDSDVVQVSLTRVEDTTNLYFDIIAVSGGETNIYAQSKDGSIKSQPLHVIVQEPIKVESIELQGYKSDLLFGEKTVAEAIILPENAEDRTITWTSSDGQVAQVDDNGNITAVGDGQATITATSSNGIESSFEVNVDGTKRLMNLDIKRVRQDDLNIGNEWSYVILVNGESPSNTMGVSLGDTITFYAEFTESDDDPDVGSAEASYTVTQEALDQGFWVSTDLYVTENGGRYRGQSAHFVVTYTFSPVEY